MCAAYMWILCDHVLLGHRWPIEIPKLVIALLGIYSGSLWLLVSFIQKND